MQRFFLPLLYLFMLWLPWSAEAQRPAHLDTALTYFGPKELQDENYGPAVNRFLAAVSLPPGNPYCAAFVSFCLDAPDRIVARPRVRTGLAQEFITDRSIEAKKVMRGYKKIPAGSIGIHKKGNTRFGHTWFVLLDWRGPAGVTIEANTGTGLPGQSERDGQGVWIRRRIIYPTNYFRVTHFTLVEYAN